MEWTEMTVDSLPAMDEEIEVRQASDKEPRDSSGLVFHRYLALYGKLPSYGEGGWMWRKR